MKAKAFDLLAFTRIRATLAGEGAGSRDSERQQAIKGKTASSTLLTASIKEIKAFIQTRNYATV